MPESRISVILSHKQSGYAERDWLGEFLNLLHYENFVS